MLQAKEHEKDQYKEIYEHINDDYPMAVYFVKPDE